MVTNANAKCKMPNAKSAHSRATWLLLAFVICHLSFGIWHLAFGIDSDIIHSALFGLSVDGIFAAAGSGVKSSPGLMNRSSSSWYCFS